jgi:dihydrofolate reductase
VTFVVAAAENGVIGKDGRLPWRIRSELAGFRAATLGKPIVMGRKTYDSIGKPLDRRTNIVVSRDTGFAAPGIVVAYAVASALALARGDALRRGVDEICVIGGAEIFNQTMSEADRLRITHVRLRPDGDTFLPPVDPAVWREVSRSQHEAGPGDDAGYAVADYERVRRDETARKGQQA